MKRVILILLVLGLLGTGGFFGWKFYKNYKELKAENQILNDSVISLNDTINQLNNTIDTMSEQVTVYALTDSTEASAGNRLRMSMVKAVNVNKADYQGELYITEEELPNWIGKLFKFKVNPGQILLKQMFRDSNQYNQQIFWLDIVPPYLPVGLRVGDSIQMNFELPTGESFVVLSAKRVEKLDPDTRVLSIEISEAEKLLFKSVQADCAEYSEYGARWTIQKYVEDNDDQVAFYPVRGDMNTLAELSPNISDTTRLVNNNIRRYIDYVLMALKKKQENRDTALDDNYERMQDAEINSAFENDWKQEFGIEETTEPVKEKEIKEDSSALFNLGG